jgi:hypothetical protein
MSQTQNVTETQNPGAGIGIIGLAFAGIGWATHVNWLVIMATVLAMIGVLIWLNGALKRR